MNLAHSFISVLGLLVTLVFSWHTTFHNKSVNTQSIYKMKLCITCSVPESTYIATTLAHQFDFSSYRTQQTKTHQMFHFKFQMQLHTYHILISTSKCALLTMTMIQFDTDLVFLALISVSLVTAIVIYLWFIAYPVEKQQNKL